MHVDKITFNKLDYAIVIRKGFAAEKSDFFTGPQSPMQFGVIAHKAGYLEAPHTHQKINIKADIFQMLYIVKGKLAVDFFNSKGIKEGEVIVTKGDAVLLMNGGHAIRVLEDVECITAKQGPYAGIENDKIVLPAASGSKGGL
ncbi:MAG: hypothetical protein PHO42_00595 [Candidatus Omnitrophica bacterium]|nr:hypothetical protein [Candidatus Omnitrophota bacterium]